MWNIGDEAVATNGDSPSPGYKERTAPPGDPIDLGTVLKVAGVVVVNGYVGLIFDEKKSGHRTGAYLASCFEKVEKRAASFDFKQWLKLPKNLETIR